MNPDMNKFEKLFDERDSALDRALESARRELERSRLVRPDGSPVPEHWTVLSVGQLVVVEGYTFKVGHIGESHLLLEPAGSWKPGDADSDHE